MDELILGIIITAGKISLKVCHLIIRLGDCYCHARFGRTFMDELRKRGGQLDL